MSKRYDISLKNLIKGIPYKFLELITGRKFSSIKFLDVKLPKILEKEADLIFSDEKGSIYHIEIQSFNDKEMPLRMLLYFSLILANYGKAPFQYVIYVGEEPLRMENTLKIGNLEYSYNLVNLSEEIPCEELLRSSNPNDWILSILCKTDDEERLVKEVLRRIASLEDERKKRELLSELLIVAGLRKKKILNIVAKEVKSMPITIDLEEHPLLKESLERKFKEGLEKAKKEDTINLYRELKLSPEKIAKLLNIPRETVIRFLKEEKLID